MNKGKILLYVILCAVLAAFLVEAVIILSHTLSDTESKQPGLTFSPRPLNFDYGDNLIWYNASDKKGTRYWINELDRFLQAYTTATKSKNVQDCRYLDKPDKGKVCDFSVGAQFAPCRSEYNYGFESRNGGPCVFLTLEKIEGWIPEYYNSSTVPVNMSLHLKEHIRRNEYTESHQVVWVDCTGENPADIENIGPINYYPLRGFEGKYFPFTNIEGYLSPLVAVHFEQPRRGLLINVECMVWIPNIQRDRMGRKGLVHFELMVDE